MPDPDLELAVRAAGLPGAITADLATAGGILRCGTCGAEQPPGDLAAKLRHGWPKCCGYTMTWVTQRQLDEEAAPPVPVTPSPDQDQKQAATEAE